VPRIDSYDAAPEYAIVGGLVFVPLSNPWAELKSNDKTARALIHQHCGFALPEEGRQVVILSKVLAHPCNAGFHSLSNVVLDTFGAMPIRNVAHLAEAVTACEAMALVFEFLRPLGDGKELVVLDRAECLAAEQEVLAQHLIGSPCMVRQDGKGEPQPLSLRQSSQVPLSKVRATAPAAAPTMSPVLTATSAAALDLTIAT